jgi:small subunit ribosomal protein S6
MYILDSNRFAQEGEKVVERLEEMIRKAGGEILVSRLWEERRLAYPIKGHRRGTYWLMYFRVDSSQISGIRRQCQLSEEILRTLFLRVDPRLVDALVAHARTATVVSTPEAAEAVVSTHDELTETSVVVDAIEGEVELDEEEE